MFASCIVFLLECLRRSQPCAWGAHPLPASKFGRDGLRVYDLGHVRFLAYVPALDAAPFVCCLALGPGVNAKGEKIARKGHLHGIPNA